MVGCMLMHLLVPVLSHLGVQNGHPSRSVQLTGPLFERGLCDPALRSHS